MKPSHGDTIRPGEGFNGFPKRLPDDCVEYSIHIVSPTIQDHQRRELLRHIISAADALIKDLLREFIWQREQFRLDLIRDNGGSFLMGRTNYGDSVDDEWLIVYLLRELSRQFPEAWIRIVDSDGEFLLIEAASALPNWLESEIADNRVWLNNGELLIIPMSWGSTKSVQETPRAHTLTLHQACSCIRGDRSRLLHLPALEAEAFYRLRNYPKQIENSIHHAIVTIPRRLAYVLHHNAAYVSPAVEAFYVRDPIALRPLQVQALEQLVFPPNDLVTTTVKFTRAGYAQLRSQHFPPPLVWSSVVKTTHIGSSGFRMDIGMKLTCGFEMLLSDPQNQDIKIVREIKLLLEDLQTGEDQLPVDGEIALWGLRQDDEKWLDIDFRDFDNDLSGKVGGSNSLNGGFGDKVAQENLRKMVSRFHDFLQDDSALGPVAVEAFGDMDQDEDDEESSVSSSNDSNDREKHGSFEEDEFTTMMRAMMGMPAGTMQEIMGPSERHSRGESGKRALSTDPGTVREAAKLEDADEDDNEEIRSLSRLMEAELRAAGALQLDPVTHDDMLEEGVPDVKGGTNSTMSRYDRGKQRGEVGDLEGEVVDVNYNLAKNMLESFEGQGGLAGPGGNLMGMMGLRLPRDETDSTG